MENASSRLLSALKSSGTEKIFEAYEWLQQHKHEFRKEVYGPVLLAVFSSVIYMGVALLMDSLSFLFPWYAFPQYLLYQVKVLNREHAAYLEGHVPYYIWKVLSTLF